MSVSAATESGLVRNKEWYSTLGVLMIWENSQFTRDTPPP